MSKPAALSDDDKKKLSDIGKKKYSEQAIWFLNGWLHEMKDDDKEHCFVAVQKFGGLDPNKKSDGNDLDEFCSHKLLETFERALTVIAMREALRQIDLDSNGRMSAIEYFVWKFKRPIPETVNAPQGTSPELEAAKQRFAEVEHALKECLAAIDDLKKQETEYKKKCDDAEEKSNNPRLSTVLKSKAAAELAQLKAEDPLPLRKAKITQEAASRRLQKVFDEAKAALEELKRNGKGLGNGTLWWMDRELIETAKYLPKAKAEKLLSPRGLKT